MSDVENFNVNMNLVGFGLDASEKFTKQIDTINRMNAAQDRLKYFWGIGKQIQNCQVHFVISSPLPAYLENTSDPVLTNQNIETDNIIPCPYPVTTFDLMDILAYVESLIPESRAQIQQDTEQEEQDEEENEDLQAAPVDFASMSLYERARLGLNNKLNQIETPTPAPTATPTTSNPPTDDKSTFTFKSYQATTAPTEAPKKETFTTYGSFNMENSTHKNTVPESKPEASVTEKPVVSSWTNAYQKSNVTEEVATPSTTPAPTTPPEAKPTETFIRYGSWKSDSSETTTKAAETQAESPKATAASEPTPSTAPMVEAIVEPAPTLAATPEPSTAPTVAPVAIQEPAPAAENNVVTKPAPVSSTSVQTKDIWTEFFAQPHALTQVQEPAFYLDAEQKIIASTYKNATELAYGLIKQTEIVSDSVKNIPNDLKKLPLPAVLWSYGLHHPHAEQLLSAMDVENHEWKLKGFPRFGLWETHPTWLFLATFFAQKHQSVFAAQAKGKADATQIKNFICAAKLAGLTWDSHPLAEDIKQQQLAELSEHPHKEGDSWISRLRSKLHINEHFES